MKRRPKAFVIRAIKRLAVAHDAFTGFAQGMKALRRDVVSAKKKKVAKDVRREMSAFAYIGASEQRFENAEEKVEGMLTWLQAQKTLQPATQWKVAAIKRRLHVEAANLIRDASRFEGRIRTILLDIKEAVEGGKTGTAKELLEELEHAIKNAQQWVAALSSDLGRAERIVEAYYPEVEGAEHGRDPNLEDFSNKRTLNRIVALFKINSFHEVTVASDPSFYSVRGYYVRGKRRLMLLVSQGKRDKNTIQVYFDNPTERGLTGRRHDHLIFNVRARKGANVTFRSYLLDFMRAYKKPASATSAIPARRTFQSRQIAA